MDRLEVYIWGTGKLAKKYFFCLEKHYKICGFYDNDVGRHNKLLLGLPILKREQKHKKKIILASTYWKEIAQQLDKEGLVLFDDYIPYSIFDKNGILNYDSLYDVIKGAREIGIKQANPFDNDFLNSKKLVVIYGNCQTRIMEKIFNLSIRFHNDYIVIGTPKMYEIDSKKECILYFLNDDLLWQRIDLLIYQSVKEDNRFLAEFSTNRIIRKLGQQCNKINIVNLYFEGYFPQYKKQNRDALKDVQHSGLFPYGDKYLDGFLKENTDKREAYLQVLDENYIPEEDILSCIRNSFFSLEQREQLVDVKISDYIKEFFTEEQLFYSPNHPCNKILIEYVNRILEKLGYEREVFDDATVWCECETLKGQDLPIYPSVLYHLKLKHYEKLYYPNRYLTSSMLVDFEGYVKYYLDILENLE